MDNVVELRCADGTTLMTTKETLARAPYSKLNTDETSTTTSDAKMLAIMLDTLRRDDQRLVVPDDFNDWGRLANEARRLGLSQIAELASPCTICVACHVALSAGRLNPEVTFRKLSRIVISGKLSVCRAVFGSNLNETRDGGGTDFDQDRYTSRVFLKHGSLERAFDTLASCGFKLCHANTFAPSFLKQHSGSDSQFLHHSQYIFTRDPKVMCYVPSQGGP
uniref:KCTD8/12/16 H1 domain-containing protein n=1 Tax=Haemonchus contortus TaxID=6289 RepID=A0A7I4XX39_HAECO